MDRPPLVGLQRVNLDHPEVTPARDLVHGSYDIFLSLTLVRPSSSHPASSALNAYNVYTVIVIFICDCPCDCHSPHPLQFGNKWVAGCAGAQQLVHAAEVLPRLSEVRASTLRRRLAEAQRSAWVAVFGVKASMWEMGKK